MSGLAGLLNRVPTDWEADAHDEESFLRCGEDGWSNDLGPGFKDEVLLAALAPEMADWAIRAADFLRDAGFTRYGDEPGDDLLAEFARLNEKAEQ